MLTVGLISDTHGLLRPQALAALDGVSQIVHAGDVGSAAIIPALQKIAPVTAVRGNVDHGDWADALPSDAVLRIQNVNLYVVHRLEDLTLDPAAGGFAAVIYGHTHKPLIENRGGILYINPGSAGPRRFKLPISIGFLKISDRGLLHAWTQTLEMP